MDSNDKLRRGAYRIKRIIPRQTVYSKKKRNAETWEALETTIAQDSATTDEGGGNSSTDPTVYANATVSPSSSDVEETNDTTVHDDVIDDVENHNGDVMNNGSAEDDVSLNNGASVSPETSHLLVSSYMCRHHLTVQAREDLLRLLQLHLPVNNGLPSTVYMLNKHADHTVDITPTFHYYCSSCYSILPGNETTTCPNESCQTALKESKDYFITVSVSKQLQVLLKRQGFYDSLVLEECNNETGLCDIRHGNVYQKFKQSEAHHGDVNISFTLNTDGALLFQSKNCSMWPVLLMINELPFNQRRSPNNIILAGLWFSDEKPPMRTFLQPVVEMLLPLESVGIQVDSPGVSSSLTLKAYTICASFDLPARASALNIMQYNGIYGCNFCEQPGSTLRTEKGGNVHVFLYNVESPKGPMRTHVSQMRHARKAVEQDTVEFGVKGPSWLSCLRHFDVIQSVSPEYMHLALLGVSKTVLNLWISAPDIQSNMAEIERRISNIEVPSEINREPRGLSEMKHWKASEYRAWTLLYCLPVLRGILDEEYLQHFVLFSEALWLLLQSAVSPEDIAKAERMLQHFCFKFSAFYGDRYCTANVHGLLHLADAVRNLGPLWAHSAFPFEGMNGWLGDLYHGTREPQKQIVKAVLERQRLSAASEQAIRNSNNETVNRFLSNMFSKGQRYSVTCEFGRSHQVLGKVSRIPQLTPEEMEQLEEFNVAYSTMKHYRRVILRGTLYSSMSYRTESMVKNDSVVLIHHNGQMHLGAIKDFLSFCSTSCVTCTQPCEHVVIILPYTIHPDRIGRDDLTNATAAQIFHCSIMRQPKVFSMKNIQRKCVMIKTNGNDTFYVALLPNNKENNL